MKLSKTIVLILLLNNAGPLGTEPPRYGVTEHNDWFTSFLYALYVMPELSEWVLKAEKTPPSKGFWQGLLETVSWSAPEAEQPPFRKTYATLLKAGQRSPNHWLINFVRSVQGLYLQAGQTVLGTDLARAVNGAPQNRPSLKSFFVDLHAKKHNRTGSAAFEQQVYELFNAGTSDTPDEQGKYEVYPAPESGIFTDVVPPERRGLPPANDSSWLWNRQMLWFNHCPDYLFFYINDADNGPLKSTVPIQLDLGTLIIQHGAEFLKSSALPTEAPISKLLISEYLASGGTCTYELVFIEVYRAQSENKNMAVYLKDPTDHKWYYIDETTRTYGEADETRLAQVKEWKVQIPTALIYRKIKKPGEKKPFIAPSEEPRSVFRFKQEITNEARNLGSFIQMTEEMNRRPGILKNEADVSKVVSKALANTTGILRGIKIPSGISQTLKTELEQLKQQKINQAQKAVTKMGDRLRTLLKKPEVPEKPKPTEKPMSAVALDRLSSSLKAIAGK